MPFKSNKQRRYLWANEPEIAREWTDRYGARGGGIMRVPLANGLQPDPFYKDEEFQTFQQPIRHDLSQYPYRGPTQSGYVNTGKILGYSGEEGYDDNLSFEKDFRGNKLSDTGVQMAYKTPRTIADQVMADFIARGIIQDEDLEGYSDWGYRDEKIGKGSKFYDPTHSRIQSILKPVRSTWNKYGKPVMGGIMSAVSGIPGMGLLLNSLRKDPYAANRIGMYGAYKDPSTGFMKDKFGYNIGTTLMKNRFMEPGSNSYRSYAIDSLNKLAGRKWDHKRYMATGKGYGPASQKQKQLNDYYQQTYFDKSFDDVMKDHQAKKPAFGDTTLGGYEGSDAGFAASEPSTASSTDWGDMSHMIARGGLAQRAPRGSYLNGGLASLWRR